MTHPLRYIYTQLTLFHIYRVLIAEHGSRYIHIDTAFTARTAQIE